jgi:O-antigen/teichoic acid export membrane protein
MSAFLDECLRAILFIYLARILGANAYGKFSFALSFVSLFVSLLDLGVSTIITREFSQDSQIKKEFSSLISLKLFSGFATLVIIFASSFFITPAPEIRIIIWVMAVFSFLTQFPQILYAFLRARQRMEYEAWANIFHVTLVTACAFFVLFKWPSAINVSYGYLFSGALTVIPILLFFHYKFLPLEICVDFRIWKKFLLMSWPLAMTSIFTMLYSYTDSIMMGYLGQITQTGWYNASLRIARVIWVPGSIVCLSFFPVMAKSARESKGDYQKIWNYLLGTMLFLSVPMVIGGTVLAPKIINFLYGPDFGPSILALQILIIMGGVTFICVPLSYILIIANHQDKTFWVTVTGAVINVILNLILIPRYSLYGAAVASVASYLIVLVLYFLFARWVVSIKLLSPEIFSAALRISLASLVMSLIISLRPIYQLNVLFSILVGAAIYLIVLGVTNAKAI